MPAAGYYAFRSLATAMDQASPAEIAARFSAKEENFESYGFRKPSGEVMVSVSVAGAPADGSSRRTKSDVRIAGVRPRQLIAVDLLNGFEQQLNWQMQGNDILISGLYIPDYPILIRVIQ
jgi:hypothetical protein